MLVFDVADDWFDGGAPSHLPLDLRCDAALLLGCVDLELVVGRRVVAAISGIGMNALDGVADELLDRRNDAGERVTIIGIAGQRLGMDRELAALAALERGGDAHLDAELIGLVRLSLTDAFDLWGMQAVDLGAALTALLFAHPAGKVEQPCELGLEKVIVCDLAFDVADDAAEIGLELAQRLVGALELAGMGVTLMPDEFDLADPRIRLARRRAAWRA